MTKKTPDATKITLLMTILLVAIYAAIGFTNWLNSSSKTDPNLRMDQLTNPDNAELQSRINSKLFGNDMEDAPGIGEDIDSTLDQSAMDAKLAGLTKNVTTQTIPGDQQLKDFYQQNKEHYREPAKLWLSVDTFSTGRYGSQVFDQAEQALENPSKPQGDIFDRYGAILSTELEEKYGRAFTEKLLSLISNSESLPCWAGPIGSAIGAHLVCVKKIDWGVYTPLEEIRSQLINDWRFSVTTKS